MIYLAAWLGVALAIISVAVVLWALVTADPDNVYSSRPVWQHLLVAVIGVVTCGLGGGTAHWSLAEISARETPEPPTCVAVPKEAQCVPQPTVLESPAG